MTTTNNPLGLGPMPSEAELKVRRERLLEAARTAAAAADRVAELRARCLATGPVALPPLRWWGEEG